MRKPGIKAIVAVVLLAIAIALGMVAIDKVKAIKRQSDFGAKYILLQTYLCYEKGKEPTQQFVARVATIAVSIMTKYEKVTVQFYVSEGGRETAVIIAENRKYR